MDYLLEDTLSEHSSIPGLLPSPCFENIALLNSTFRTRFSYDIIYILYSMYFITFPNFDQEASIAGMAS